MRHYVYKYRLYPNINQEIYFAKCFGCSRLIWNLLLDAKRNYYANYKVMLKREVSFYKSMKKYEFLKEVDSLALSNAKMNLDIAFSRFFNKISGFPRFKKKGVDKDTYTTNNSITSNGSSNIKIVGSYIKLPKIGLVKIELHRPLEGKIKHVTVSKEKSGDYYISILVETDKDFTSLVPVTTNKIGLDMGIKSLYTDSNGNKCLNPRFHKKSLERLKLYQKSLSRKKKGGKNREKAKIKLAKKYRKIANQRRDYLHKESKRIINENHVICLETLNVTSMYKRKIKKVNQSISDTGIGMFIEMLKYKADLYGRTIKTVSKYYPSSQMCSSCGSINKGMKKLNKKTLVCNKCGTVLDRDVNAAINILKGCS